MGQAPHPSHSGPQSRPRSAPGPGCGFYKPENGSQGQPRLSGERGHGDAEEIAPWERQPSRGKEAGRAAFTRGRERGRGAGRCWHAGRAARGVTAYSRLPAPVRCFGGGFSTRRCLGGSITARMAQVLGLLPWVGGAPEVTKPGGSGHRSNSLQPSPREGRDFWGKEGLPSSPTCHTCFLFFFSPPFQLRPMAFPALAAAKGSWHTHTWWALHV